MNAVKQLKQVHLSRLSPVMWTLQTGYPRPEIAVPIQEINGGMGMGEADPANSDGRYVATPINPKASPLWSNIYRLGAAGALSRVAPYGPDAFGTDNGNGEMQPSTFGALWPFFLAFGGMALLTYFGTRRSYPRD
jgi:hypothetical protein